MGATGSIPEQYTAFNKKPAEEEGGLKIGKNNVPKILQEGLKHGIKVVPKAREERIAKEKANADKREANAQKALINRLGSVLEKIQPAGTARGGKRTQKNKKRVKFSRKIKSVRKL